MDIAKVITHRYNIGNVEVVQAGEGMFGHITDFRPVMHLTDTKIVDGDDLLSVYIATQCKVTLYQQALRNMQSILEDEPHSPLGNDGDV